VASIILKNNEQIEGIRKSSILAAQTLKYLEPFVKPGITTLELNDLADKFIQLHGAVAATKGYKGYKYATCISPNDVVCHGVPNAYELKYGDALNIDVTTILNGFYGDTSRMYEVGEVSAYAKQLIKVTNECLNLGMKECYPGNRLGNIGYVISQHAEKHGYSVVHEFCGHGVGIHFHEEPQVDHKADKNSGLILKPGMTFTIEPMINAGKARTVVDKKDKWTARTIDGKLSAQFEHTILITENGFEALTDINGDY